MATSETISDEEPSPKGDSVSFSLTGLRQGYIACIPVSIGVAGYGLVFGMLAQQAGLSIAESALMSATVLAGAAQLIAVKLVPEASIATILLTTLLVNLRYVLMSASLHPWLKKLSGPQAYLSMFFTADENWALTMSELRDGSDRGAFLLGSGLTIWSFWIIATVIGAASGGLIGDPSRFGLDFVFLAVFLTIAADLWSGVSDIVPWVAALAVSVTGYLLLPGQWYVLLGGSAGMVAEVMRDA